MEYATELEAIQSTFLPRTFSYYRPQESEVPQIFVTLPDVHEQIILAPLYDAHIGSSHHDEPLFDEHIDWVAKTPNAFTWNGGDAFENKTPNEGKMGIGEIAPEDQLTVATRKFGKVRHKMFVSMLGNHEARTFKQSGMDSAKRLAENLQVPYFMDYAFITIRWRGNNFRLMAHHGTGGNAQTPGGQRNSARKELDWFKPDILWTGHLHQSLIDPVAQYDTNQTTGEIFERDLVVVQSPSYQKHFGSFTAGHRMRPGVRGMNVLILNENGRIDANIHARGKRL